MSQMILFGNPRKRKAKKSTTKKRRTRRAAGSAPARRAAPKRRRKASVRTITKTVYRKAYGAGKRVVRRVRRNPGGLTLKSFGSVQPLAKSAAIGAVGALALDFTYSYLPLPASMQTGMVRHAVKGAIGIGMGMLISRFVKGNLGTDMARGALTVALYDAGRELTGKANVPVGEYVMNGVGYMNPAELPGVDDDEMGAYDVGAYDVGEYV